MPKTIPEICLGRAKKTLIKSGYQKLFYNKPV
jgi:hypothetical protein